MARTHEADPVAIVPDDATDDTDSSLGDDLQSSTASISSSILNYRRENGRTYHAYKDGKYVLPNDEAENERLDLQHNLFILTFDDKLGPAPPNNPDAKVKHVLDVGTGTGIWAIDYADEHPKAQVLTLPYFAHPTSNLIPGGYLEIQEVDINIKSDDGTLSPDNIMLKSLALLKESFYIMKHIGFVDVVVESFRWPINSWPKDKKAKLLGSWCYTNMACGLEAFTMAPLTRAHGWTPEEVNLWLVHQRKAMADRDTHAYWQV
ncbi:hypothetical protein IL306_014162 [Fusarium sp. DS 682]|nr:hypothetical protein IL306_014162 [Fusarium sp. DS 682]